MPPLLHRDERGIRCDAGGFWIDPWRPVPLALITHAHADHARPGMGRYICIEDCLPALRRRLPQDADITPLAPGEPTDLGRTRVTFHPAGHCLGSAQVRVEGPGEVGGKPASEVAVAAGDYKRQHDPTCAAFEVVPCDTFITEATFALPIYRFQPGSIIARDILAWWDTNRQRGRVSVLCAYALGKAQRILGELLPLIADRPAAQRRIFNHGALESMLDAYRELGVELPLTFPISDSARARGKANPFRGELVLCPPGASASPWIRRFGRPADVDVAFASGWMRVRGIRRRRNYDRGFVLSDHADWPDLLRTIDETGTTRVLCTHGYNDTLARYLREHRGIDASPLETAFGGDDTIEAATAEAPD